MESGPSKAAAAGLGVNPRRKVKAAAASASSFDRGSRSAAAPFSVGRRSGSPTGLVPVRRGGVPAAPVFPSNSPSTMATSVAANSAPIGSFTVHDIARTPGFPFPPPPSPALWASNGGTPVSPSPSAIHMQLEALRVNSAIKARPTHRKLKNDLIAHVWQRYGNKEN